MEIALLRAADTDTKIHSLWLKSVASLSQKCLFVVPLSSVGQRQTFAFTSMRRRSQESNFQAK